MSQRVLSAMVTWFFLGGALWAEENLIEKMTFPAGSKSVFIREGNDVHIKAPETNLLANIVGRPPSLWDGRSKFTMSGNFEFMVDYSINQLGPKTGRISSEANAEIAVEGSGPFSLYGINVNAQPNDPMTFRINRFERDSSGRLHYDIKKIPRTSNVGRIGFRREGSQMIFLAADGPGEEVKELVRLPYNSKIEPFLKLSAYQGNGKSLMPIDVVFSHITYRADKIDDNPGQRVVNPPVVPATETYETVLDYSKAPGRLLADLKHGNDSPQAIRTEGKGLRIRPPVAEVTIKDAQNYWYRETAYDLQGDFEISARFEVTQMGPPPKEGYGSLGMNIGLETSGPLGSFSFGRGVSRGDGQRYHLTRFSPTSGGRTWDIQSFKTTANEGRLIVRRTGETLYFLVEDEDFGLRELFQCPAIMSTPLKFRISADQGGTNTGVVDVLLSEISVKAQSIIDQGKPVKSFVAPPGVLDSGTSIAVEESVPASPRKWLYVVLGIGIAGGLGAAGFLALRRKGGAADARSVSGEGRTRSQVAAGANSTANANQSVAPAASHSSPPEKPAAQATTPKDSKNPNQGKNGK